MFEDQLLGLNWQTQDIAAALGKASALSKHNSDAAWLVKILGDGKKAPSPEEARALLLAHDKDARALCFAGLVARPIDQDLVKRAADMGLPFAQGWMAEIMGQEDRAQWAKKAADQGDARGTCMLALCLEDDGDVEQAAVLQRKAAEAGHVDAMYYLSFMDPKGGWLEKAAAHGHEESIRLLQKNKK